MQNVDIKALELEIQDESQVMGIYFRNAAELGLFSELLLIEREVMDEFYIEKGVPTAMRVKLAWAKTRHSAELVVASQKNLRKAQNHRRRLQRLMSQYDALIEG